LDQADLKKANLPRISRDTLACLCRLYLVFVKSPVKYVFASV